MRLIFAETSFAGMDNEDWFFLKPSEVLYDR